MALIACPACGGKVSTNASACPHCGEPVVHSTVAPVSNSDDLTVDSAQSKKNDRTSDWETDHRLRAISRGVMSFSRSKLILTSDACESLRKIFEECAAVTKHLEIMGPSWRDRHFEHLSLLSDLEELKLYDCSDLTDEALLCMSKLTSLKKLRLGGWVSGKISLQGLKLLTRLRSIELIELPHLGMRKAGLLDEMGMYKPSSSVRAFMDYLKQQIPDAIIQCQ